MLGRDHIQIKTPDQVRQMRRAGLVVADVHAALREAVRPGVTTAELDAVSSDAIAAAGAASNFLGYYDYPATVCVSVNDVVVHGIPGGYRLRAGDLVSFDCGAWLTRRVLGGRVRPVDRRRGLRGGGARGRGTGGRRAGPGERGAAAPP